MLKEVADQEGGVAHPVSISRRIDPWADWMTIISLSRLFKKLSPRIVHSHTPKAGLVAMMAAAAARVPIRLYHVHGAPYLTATGVERHLLKTAERAACALATNVYSVSNSMRSAMAAHGIRRADMVRVIGPGSINGVDCERFDRNRAANQAEALRPASIPKNAPIVGVVGRLARDKGISDLLHIWPLVNASVPLAHLLIVGESDARQPTSQATLDALRGLCNVHFVGHKNDVVPWYAMMSILCIPSYREGFCSVALEAAAMEVPVVGYNVVGCEDSILHGRTGFLAGRNEYSDVADHIVTLLTNSRLASEMGHRARRRATSEFESRRIANAMADEYDRLIAVQRPAAAGRDQDTQTVQSRVTETQ